MSSLILEKPPSIESESGETDQLVAMLVGYKPYSLEEDEAEHFCHTHGLEPFEPSEYQDGYLRVLVFDSFEVGGRFAGGIDSFYDTTPWPARAFRYLDVDVELFSQDGLFYSRARIPESDCWKNIVNHAAENNLDYRRELKREVLESIDRVTSCSPHPFPIKQFESEIYEDAVEEIDDIVCEPGGFLLDSPEYTRLCELDMQMYNFFLNLFEISPSTKSIDSFFLNTDEVLRTCYGFDEDAYHEMYDDDCLLEKYIRK